MLIKLLLIVVILTETVIKIEYLVVNGLYHDKNDLIDEMTLLGLKASTDAVYERVGSFLGEIIVKNDINFEVFGEKYDFRIHSIGGRVNFTSDAILFCNSIPPFKDDDILIKRCNFHFLNLFPGEFVKLMKKTVDLDNLIKGKYPYTQKDIVPIPNFNSFKMNKNDDDDDDGDDDNNDNDDDDDYDHHHKQQQQQQQKPAQLLPAWLTTDNKLHLRFGDNMREKARAICALSGPEMVDSEDCFFLISLMSNVIYDITYTPLNPVSLEDFSLKRYHLISAIAKKYQYKRYLEIGCDLNHSFDELQSQFDVSSCVDPRTGGNYRMTSDAFFAQNQDYYDIIFIDGLHEEEQALRDVHSALRWLAPGGTILMHDLNPQEDVNQRLYSHRQDWTGDPWKVAVELRLQDGIEIVVADIDYGVGIIRRRLNKHRLPLYWENRLLRKSFSQHRIHQQKSINKYGENDEDYLRNEDFIMSTQESLHQFVHENIQNALNYSDLKTHRTTLLRLMNIYEVIAWLDEEE